MAASVGGIAQLDPAPGITWPNDAVAGATAVAAASGSTAGIDGADCELFQNLGNSLVIGTHYSFWSDNFATAGNGFDVSGIDQAVHIHLRHVGPTGFYAYESNADSVWLILFSGGTDANYAIYEHSGAGLNDGVWRILKATGTPATTGGSWNNTDVTGVGIAVEAGDESVFGFQLAVDQPVHTDSFVDLEDTGSPATLEYNDFYDLLKPSSGETYHSLLFQKADFAYANGAPVRLMVDDFDNSSSVLGIGSRAGDLIGFDAPVLGYNKTHIIGQANGSFVLTTSFIATTSTPMNVVIDGSATNTTITMPSTTFDGINDISITGAGVTGSCVILNPATCAIGDGNFDAIINGSVAAIQWNTDLITGAKITTDSDIDINFDVGDYSDIELIFTASNTVTVDPTTDAGTYDLTNMTTTGTVTFVNASVNDVTISIPPGMSHVNGSPGTITIDNAAVVNVEVTVTDSLGNPIENATVFLEESVGGADVLLAETNASGIATTTYVYTTDTTVTGHVRVHDGPTIYKEFSLGGSILAIGYTTTAILSED